MSLSLLLGDVFKAINPWRALARAFAWAGGKVSREGLPAPLPYTERLSLYGIDAWTRNADAFSVPFGLFAMLSPLRWKRGAVFGRLPLSGLSTFTSPAWCSRTTGRSCCSPTTARRRARNTGCWPSWSPSRPWDSGFCPPRTDNG